MKSLALERSHGMKPLTQITQNGIILTIICFTLLCASPIFAQPSDNLGVNTDPNKVRNDAENFIRETFDGTNLDPNKENTTETANEFISETSTNLGLTAEANPPSDDVSEKTETSQIDPNQTFQATEGALNDTDDKENILAEATKSENKDASNIELTEQSKDIQNILDDTALDTVSIIENSLIVDVAGTVSPAETVTNINASNIVQNSIGTANIQPTLNTTSSIVSGFGAPAANSSAQPAGFTPPSADVSGILNSLP